MTGVQVFDGKGIWVPREGIDKQVQLYVGELSKTYDIWLHKDRWENIPGLRVRRQDGMRVPVYLIEDGKMWYAVNWQALKLDPNDGAKVIFGCTHLAGGHGEAIEP